MEDVIGRTVASAAVALTALTLAPAGFIAVAPAFAALALVPLAIRWHSRTTALLAATALLGGVVTAGTLDLQPGLLVVATLGTVLAWDATSQAIDLREQLDDADIRRALLAHVGATLAATALVGSTAYLVFLLVAAIPPVAVVLFLGGAVLLVLGLEPRETSQAG